MPMDDKSLIQSTELLAHKLRNPIHAAGINLEALAAKLRKTKVDPSILKHLEIVSGEIKRVNVIVERYLKFVKLDATEQSKFNLRKLLDQ